MDKDLNDKKTNIDNKTLQSNLHIIMYHNNNKKLYIHENSVIYENGHKTDNHCESRN